jgi:hypothetical protein
VDFVCITPITLHNSHYIMKSRILVQVVRNEGATLPYVKVQGGELLVVRTVNRMLLPVLLGLALVLPDPANTKPNARV